LAFVLEDEDGNPQNSISVVDTVDGTYHTFPLRAPLVDGETIGTVLYAEVMDFTADGNFLLYDAFDQIDLGGGATRSFYSVYALDLVNDRTLELFNPEPGVDVGNPSQAHTSDNFLVVDIVDNGAGHVVAVDLTTGDPVDLANITGLVPSRSAYRLKQRRRRGRDLTQADIHQPARPVAAATVDGDRDAERSPDAVDERRFLRRHLPARHFTGPGADADTNPYRRRRDAHAGGMRRRLRLQRTDRHGRDRRWHQRGAQRLLTGVCVPV
jgi:hypothetical protein